MSWLGVSIMIDKGSAVIDEATPWAPTIQSTSSRSAHKLPTTVESQAATDAHEMLSSSAVLPERIVLVREIIKSDLNEAVLELKHEDAIEIRRGDIENCLELAHVISPLLALYRDVRFAATADIEGTVSLILQSERSGRRVGFDFANGQKEFRVVKVDEHLRVSSTTANLSDRRIAISIARWVTRAGSGIQF